MFLFLRVLCGESSFFPDKFGQIVKFEAIPHVGYPIYPPPAARIPLVNLEIMFYKRSTFYFMPFKEEKS